MPHVDKGPHVWSADQPFPWDCGGWMPHSQPGREGESRNCESPLSCFYCWGIWEAEGPSGWSEAGMEWQLTHSEKTNLLFHSSPHCMLLAKANQYEWIHNTHPILTCGVCSINTGWFYCLTPQVAIDRILSVEMIKTLWTGRIWSGICCCHPLNPISSWVSEE